VKPATIHRLSLLALAAQTQALAQVQRHNAALGQIAQQRRVLTAYRDRLTESWRDGAEVSAGEAVRAGQFAAASEAADQQIALAEQKTRQALAAQQIELAAQLQKSRRLTEFTQTARLKTERQAERRLETLYPPNPATSRR
jgi:hypothetical protein